MGKSVENPKNDIVSARLNAGEVEDFERMARFFGSRSEVVRQALKTLAVTVGIDFGNGDFKGKADDAA